MPAVGRLWPSNDDDKEEEESGDDDEDDYDGQLTKGVLLCF